jgi:hypothetical protein
MEASFADAANHHHFKRARWRRLWRQQVQDYLIRSNPERAHPLSAPKPKAQCRSGVRCASGFRQKLAPSIASLHRIN